MANPFGVLFWFFILSQFCLAFIFTDYLTQNLAEIGLPLIVATSLSFFIWGVMEKKEVN